MDGLDLEVVRGGCAALLGQDGSGRSTALRCLGGGLPLSAGDLELTGGTGPPAVLPRTAHVPSDPPLAADRTIREHLERGSVGAPDPDAVTRALAGFGLSRHGELLPRQLSTGLRRRAELAGALASSADLLLLDDPAAGLDRRTTEHLWDRLADESARGVAIVLTSNDPWFVDGLADEVLILEAGRVVARGTFDEAVASAAGIRAGLADR